MARRGGGRDCVPVLTDRVASPGFESPPAHPSHSSLILVRTVSHALTGPRLTRAVPVRGHEPGLAAANAGHVPAAPVLPVGTAFPLHRRPHHDIHRPAPKETRKPHEVRFRGEIPCRGRPPGHPGAGSRSLSPTLPENLFPTLLGSLFPFLSPALFPTLFAVLSPNLPATLFPGPLPILSPTLSPTLSAHLSETLSPGLFPNLSPGLREPRRQTRYSPIDRPNPRLFPRGPEKVEIPRGERPTHRFRGHPRGAL